MPSERGLCDYPSRSIHVRRFLISESWTADCADAADEGRKTTRSSVLSVMVCGSRKKRRTDMKNFRPGASLEPVGDSAKPTGGQRETLEDNDGVTLRFCD